MTVQDDGQRGHVGVRDHECAATRGNARGTGRQSRRLSSLDDMVVDRADRERDRRGAGRDRQRLRRRHIVRIGVGDRDLQHAIVVSVLRVTVAVIASGPAASLTDWAEKVSAKPPVIEMDWAETARLLLVFSSKTSPNGFSLTTNQ